MKACHLPCLRIYISVSLGMHEAEDGAGHWARLEKKMGFFHPAKGANPFFVPLESMNVFFSALRLGQSSTDAAS